MQIEWNVELFDHAPERPVLRQIVIHRGVGRADLREAVDQGAPETEVLDAALQLRRGIVRVLHGQRRNAHETVGTLGDLPRQDVVCLAGHLCRPFDIGYRLDGGGIERRDHDFDAGGIHEPQPLVLEVEEARSQLRPHMGAEDLRIAERGLGREMILERDFSLHIPSGRRLWRAGLCADSTARASAARATVLSGREGHSAVFAMRADAIRISR